MATYQETESYFEILAINHKDIAHSETTKKFFQLDIEEFIQAGVKDLPGPETGPALVLINYIKDFTTPEHQALEVQQVMFYIIRAYKHLDFVDKRAARIACENVSDDFVSRFLRDSQDGHSFFKGSFDRIQDFRQVPIEHKNPTGNFVGFQCSVYLKRPFTKCYNPNKWLDV